MDPGLIDLLFGRSEPALLDVQLPSELGEEALYKRVVAELHRVRTLQLGAEYDSSPWFQQMVPSHAPHLHSLALELYTEEHNELIINLFSGKCPVLRDVKVQCVSVLPCLSLAQRTITRFSQIGRAHV